MRGSREERLELVLRSVIPYIPSDKREEVLQHLLEQHPAPAQMSPPDTTEPGAASEPTAPPGARRRRRRRLPPGLRTGIAAVNALRQNAAEFVVQRSAAEAAAEGVTLAPARAVRKRRGKDGRAFTAEYRTASGILHEPGWVLMSIDAECAQNLMAWAVMVLGEVTPRQFVPTVPTLGPDEALTVGAIFELARWWPRVGVVKSVDLMLQAVGTAPEIVMKSDLVKLAAALRKYPEWRARIRRCDYEGGRSEGCYRARLAAGGSLERGGREVWWPSARRLSASATSRGCDRARRAEHRSRGA